MSNSERSRSEKAFEILLKQNNITIVELISAPTFRSKLKSSVKVLSDFLLKDITINEICDWLLTDEFCSLPSYKPTAQSIFRIFKDSPESLQISFSQNEKLIYRLSEFAKSQKEQNLLNCAFFEQMTDFFSLITRGTFLSNFKRLPYLLAKRIEIISIRHLFYCLATNFTNQFSFSFQVVLFILHNINDRNREQVMLLFLRLVKNSSSFAAFDHPKVILALLDIAKTTEHDELISTQAFQIVESIVKNTSNPDNVQELLQQFSEDFDIASRPINYGTAVALRLFKTFIPSFVLSMVTNPTHMFMHAGILMSIEQVSDEELIPFIEENNIPVKLIWAMNVAKSNGYLTKFAILLDSKKDLSESLQTPEWTKFVNEQLKNRIELLNTPPPSNLPKKKKGKPNPKQLAKLNNLNIKNKSNSNEKTQQESQDDQSKTKTKETQQQKKSSNKIQNNKKEESRDSEKSTKNSKLEKEKKKQKEKDEKNQTETKDEPTSKPSTNSTDSTDDSKLNSIDIPVPLDVIENPETPSVTASPTPTSPTPTSPTSPSRQRRPSPIPIYTTKNSFENNPEFQEIMQNLSKCRFLHKQVIAEEIMNKRRKSQTDSIIEKNDDEIEIEIEDNKNDNQEPKSRHRSNSLRVTRISPPSTRKGLNFSSARSSSQPNSMSPPSLRSSIPPSSSSSESESKQEEKSQKKADKNTNSKNNEKSKSKSKSHSDSNSKQTEKSKSKQEKDSNDKSKLKQETDTTEKSKTETEKNEKSKSKTENESSKKSKSKIESDSQNNQKSKTDLDSKPDKKQKSKSKSNSDSKSKLNDKKSVKNESSSNEQTEEISVEIESSDSEEDKKNEENYKEEECEVLTVQDSTDNISEIYKKSEEEDFEVVELAEDVTTIGSDISFSRSIDDLPSNLIEIIPPTSINNDKNKSEEEEEITISHTETENQKINKTEEVETPSNIIITNDEQIIVFNNDVNDNNNDKAIKRDNSIDDHIRLKSSTGTNTDQSSPSSSSDILSSSDLRPSISVDDSTSKLVEDILNDEEYYQNLSSSSPFSSPLPSPSPSKQNIKEEIIKEEEINQKKNRSIRFIDIDDDFVYSSDSEDEIKEKVAVFGLLSPPNENFEPIEMKHIVLTPFGPLMRGEEGESEAEMESSGSSDDEFMFDFSEKPQKLLRKKTDFILSAKFALIDKGKFGQMPSSQPKENSIQNKTTQVKILPQLS